ncbi:MAG: hypothetical protein WDN04_19035 [Rhodospirillales bacterium]
MRLSALWDDDSGNVSNPTTGARFNATNDRAVRAQVLALVNDDLTVRIIADYARQRDKRGRGAALVRHHHADQRPAVSRRFFQPHRASRLYRADLRSAPAQHIRQHLAALRHGDRRGVGAADYTLPFGTITSISSWRY